MSRYLEALWEQICEDYDCSREHITTKPNLVIAVPKRIKFYFWKIKEEIDNLKESRVSRFRISKAWLDHELEEI